MSELKTKVKCNKDLFHNDGTKSFTQGFQYQGNICNVIENLTVINDQGEPHKIGWSWSKYFKIVK